MELGEKLRQARLEAGLSQRALCADRITRNMLSQIEHGTARPSMDTLAWLAGRLGKPVSFFLDENVVASPNQEIIAAARRYYDSGDPAAVLEVLEAYQGPDDIFDREYALLNTLARLGRAEALLETGREPYALEILDHTVTAGIYCADDLERRRLLLLSRIRETELPSLDVELLIRAEHALRTGNTEQAGHLLDAAGDRNSPHWHFLRGQAALAEQAYTSAARHFHAAEAAYPAETVPYLEICYRELGDFKRAYEYATRRQR